jgi:hypothetical protein
MGCGPGVGSMSKVRAIQPWREPRVGELVKLGRGCRLKSPLCVVIAVEERPGDPHGSGLTMLHPIKGEILGCGNSYEVMELSHG